MLKDGEIVGHLPNLVQFRFLLCVIFAISCHTSFFIFRHTTRESFLDLHQTVLQLPPLMSFSHLHGVDIVCAFLFVAIAGGIIATWILCHVPGAY